MLRSLCCRCDERKIDVCCRCGRKFFLCFLSSFFQSLKCHLISRKIYALFCLEICQHIICNLLVEIISTKSVVSCCRQYFDDAVADLDDRYIKCTASKVIYHDLLFFFIIQSISKRCCRRLVDDTFYIQTCDLTCIFCCLTLCVIEICRNSDHCLCYFLSKVSLCVCFQFLKNHCRNLLRRIFLIVNAYFVVRSHLSFDGRNRLVCVCHCLTFCRFSDKTLTCLRKCNNRRCCSCPFCIRDNGWLSTFHYGYTTVRCTQINTNDFSHDFLLLN